MSILHRYRKKSSPTDILTLKAEENNRKYYKEVLLPSPVKPETLRKTFKNGILEIRFEKK